MKLLFAVLVVLASLASQAQTTNTNNPPARAEKSIQAQIPQKVIQLPGFPAELKPNEVVIKNHVYSGIIVQAAKTKNPLQLVNPFAPPQYGSGEDNVARDPINGRPHGLKFFSVQF